MKKLYGLKSKFIYYAMSASIFIALLIICIMSLGSILETRQLVLDNMQISARMASQNISSNLHLLTERMYNISKNSALYAGKSRSEKDAWIESEKLEVEFVWLAAYDANGKKMFGDDKSPDSIADTAYYSSLKETSNIVIGDTFYDNDLLQLCVGVPVKNGDELAGYLVGSYKYDLLNDVLSMLILGDTGGAYIVDKTGKIIGDRNIENIIEQKNLYELYPHKGNEEDFETALSGQTGSGHVHMNHAKNYVGFSPIPGTNWFLLVYAPQWEFMRSLAISISIGVLVSVLALCAAGYIIVPASNKISNSLAQVTARLQALANGNLTEEVVLSQNSDETDILTDALSKTITRLNRYLQDIRNCLGSLAAGDYTIEIPQDFDGDFISIHDSLCNITDSLNQTMQQMNHSSVAINQNSSEVSAYAKQLHSRSLDQTSLLTQLDESMQAITTSIEKNRENVRQIELCSKNASEKTALGGSYMESMLDTMNEIKNSVEKISQISRLIEGISNQTNLLSLNASIEAARAGESGRGFAIVATEIGKLSEQTAEALQQTGIIISQSAEIIRAGLTTANETADAFRQIQAVTEQYNEISERLADASTEQETAIFSMDSQLGSVKDIADSNRSLAEETSQMAAGSLAQSEELRDYVAQVKIKDLM